MIHYNIYVLYAFRFLSVRGRTVILAFSSVRASEISGFNNAHPGGNNRDNIAIVGDYGD